MSSIQELPPQKFQKQDSSRDGALCTSQSSGEFYRHILQQTQEGVIVLDHELRFRYWNPAMEQLIGLASEAVLDKHVLDVLPIVQSNGAYDLLKHALMGETVHIHTFRFLNPVTGEVQWHSSRHTPLRDESGAVIGVIVTVRDVTAQQEAEARQAESDERFRKVFEEGPLGIALVGTDFRFENVNARLCELTGYTAEELLARTFVDITYPEDIDKDVDLATRLMAGEIPRYSMEKRYITKSGAILWILLTVSILHDRSGAPQYYLSLIKDISERKQAEAALTESKIRMQLALDNAQHGFWDWDIVSGSLYLDANSHVILGFNPGELELTINAWKDTIHPDDLDRLVDLLNRHLCSDDALYDAEYRARHKSGRWIWINMRGRVQSRDADGKPLRMLGTVHDITDRKSMQAQLEETSTFGDRCHLGE